MKRVLLFLFLLVALSSSAEFIRVGLFYTAPSSEYFFVASNATYSVYASGKKILTLKPDESASFILSDNRIEVTKGEKRVGKYPVLKLTCEKPDGVFRLKPLVSANAAFPFVGFVEFVPSGGKIKVINVVDIEKYVSSVVESEVGSSADTEFLKVQAIICRTFVRGHMQRHLAESFNVCDGVHCQVYHSRSRFNDAISKAVEDTRNLVLVDSHNRLIASTFSSNCGGYTAEASEVWSHPADYLKPVEDCFCVASPHALWEKTISRSDWIKYLRKQYVNIEDSLLNDSSFAFLQNNRSNEYCFNDVGIPLIKIRDDWKLKSTWFNIVPKADSLLFAGRGYGHGVGLCQEGAMSMAQSGWKVDDIVRYYFKDVSVVDYETLKLIRN